MKLRALLETSKYSKLMKYLWGIKKSKGLAIMTPENPNSNSLTPKENKDLMTKGKKLLRANGYAFFTQIGLYGQRENSLIVLDILEKDAIKIGTDWVQDSIIVITQGNLEKRSKPLFDMVRINEKSTWLDVPNTLVESILELTDTAEMYSQIGNKKYEIPFFGDNAVQVDNSINKATIKKQKIA